MESEAQSITRRTYEDISVAEAFFANNGEPRFVDDRLWQPISEFAARLRTGRVIDIGCGPGISSQFGVTPISFYVYPRKRCSQRSTCATKAALLPQ